MTSMDAAKSTSPSHHPKTIVYIDGFNLYYGAVRKTPYRWLDLEKLCRSLLPRDRIVKIRYFTARVKDRTNDPHKTVRQQIYLRALETLPLVSIHYGLFVERPARMPLACPPAEGPRTVEVLRTEEKGTDVNIATYLLLDAFKDQCNTAAVISNDSDLAEAVRVAESQAGIKVGIINPHRPNRRSRKLQGSFFKQIRRRHLTRSLLPDVVNDTQGPIRKPDTW